MADEPVILLQGPRTVGKSRLLAALAVDARGAVIDLDDLAVRSAVAADPAFMMKGDGPILVDEYQHVPEILDAWRHGCCGSRPGASPVVTRQP